MLRQSLLWCAAATLALSVSGASAAHGDQNPGKLLQNIDPGTVANAAAMISEGQNTFRFDTFGDEDFWGGTLHLNQAIVTVSPKTALAVGLKVDVDALPRNLQSQLRAGKVNLDDP